MYLNSSETLLKSATLVELLRTRGQNQPKQTAFTFLQDGETESDSLTYQELDRLSRAIAAQLQSSTVPGERALLLFPPGLEYISAFFGCLYAGVVAVPAYPPRPNRSLARLQTIVADAQASVALTTTSILSNLERQFAQAPELKTLRWLTTNQIGDLAEEWQEPAVSGDTLAFLQYTSGSTAAPKGVMITHSNLLHNLGLIHQCFEHTSNSRGVIWLPPYHDMGLIGGVLQPLYGGFPVTLMSPLVFLQNPLRWLRAISRYRATTSGGPNFAYDLCVRKITPEQLTTLDLSSWEVAFNGAEPIRHETLEQFAATFEPCGFRRQAFYPCYGLAEATLIVSGGLKIAQPVVKTVQTAALEQNRVVQADAEVDNTRTLVGCGQALRYQQIAIVHPEKLTQCADGQVGEIWVSGPSIAKSYWRKPEETQRTFHAYLADTGEGPFLRTGDLGFLEDGELFVTGRLKDVIIINGCNHYPQDIERTVEQSSPSIRQNCCAAFSVDIGGAEKLVVVAEVERRYHTRQAAYPASTAADSHLLETEVVIQTIRRAVSKHHDLQVHTVLLLKPGNIPKTSSSKIQRHACRIGFLNRTLVEVEK
ncbi:fatty acyl-AMP ligase [Chroococcidiopsis sp. CCMEE 29]|uniref:fatty acyl-AMP ligase n=1 Tax=Chroococcidiopsis sp. CCMEE 29 TaxID=155894 RepID=UPI002022029E|nr:fatty acyl-AMP ligase [Chroococcidiopsis sp. CCMEE 29]